MDPQVDPRDPENKPEINGLAHFIEHMIFMGNKVHQKESFLNDFLKANGGMKNGVTGPDHTQFFFEVKNSEFGKACEYFSEYLISPKFDENVIEREIKTIE